jgi:serine/threonine protein kinase
MKYVHDGGRIVIYVLKEFAGGGNLEIHTKKHVPVPYDLLRFYTCELLEALTYLHNKAVTHKDLRVGDVIHHAVQHKTIPNPNFVISC